MAYTMTLEGDFGCNYNDEIVDGALEDLYGAAKTAFRATTGAIKGVSHSIMETGRGIRDFDLKRIALAPAKGIGHTAGETYRGTKEHLEYYWRPSKMEWMQPTGAALTAIAPFTGPGAAVLLPLGAGLTAGGTVGNKLYADDLASKAARATSIPEQLDLQEQARKKKNQTNMWLALGAVALVGGVALAA